MLMKWKSPHGRELPSPEAMPLVMGVLNVGSGSLSDGGLYSGDAEALARAGEMAEQGADIIDIGAESTRPGAQPVSLDEELGILIPKLKSVRAHFPEMPISVDTYKPEVARIAVEEGADIINDVYACRDAGGYPMARVAAHLGAPLVLTHSCRGEICLGNFMDFFLGGMESRLNEALGEGMQKDNIILDPGVGFGKTREQNFELVKNLPLMEEFGCAVLLGVSRKSLFNGVAGPSIEELDAATCAVSAYCAYFKSAQILRVHNVAANIAAMKTILRLL